MVRRAENPDEGAPALPVETVRHWYVTISGGRSPDLALDEIGINRQAVERNTHLDPLLDRVRVTLLGEGRRPYLLDSTFRILPLDESHPDAFRRSPEGEAVFPEGDEVLRPGRSPAEGKEVILNNVVSARLGSLPSSEEFARILQDVLRGNDRGSEENA